MLLEDLQTEIKIFCDLDGVLADFIGGVQKLMPDYNQADYEADSKYRSRMWTLIRDHAKDGGKLWQDLDMMSDGMVLWNYISKYKDTEILTATGDTRYGSGDQKHVWVSSHLGSVKVNLVRKSAEKAAFAAPNHVLIDDMSKSINPWVQAGGIGILHTSATDTINKLKELGL